MDYEKIRSEVPAEEQQLYIDAKLELGRIEEMAKLSDSEYNEMLDNIKKNGDAIQLEQFLETYISTSNYERIKSENETWINEIDQKYGIGEERRVEEVRVEAIRKRQQLQRLQNYYRRHASGVDHIMSGVDDKGNIVGLDIPSLTDEEVIVLYDRVTFGIDSEKLQEMFNDDIRSRHEEIKPTPAPEPTPIFDPSDEEINKKVDELRKSIKNLDNTLKKMSTKMSKVEGLLLTGNFMDTDIVNSIKELTVELTEVNDKFKEIRKEINDLNLSIDGKDFEIDVKELGKTIESLKVRLRETKKLHKYNYNIKVEAINKRINILLNLEDVSPEIRKMIEELVLLELCDVEIREWRITSYIDKMDYEKLIDIYNKLVEIERKLNIPTLDLDLDSDIEAIEKRTDDIEKELEKGLEDKKRVLQDILFVSSRLYEFKVKLENHKDELQPAHYADYLDRINDIEKYLAEYNERIKNPVTPVPPKEDEVVEDNKLYEELKNELKILEVQIDGLSVRMEALYGLITEGAIEVFEREIKTYDGALNDLKKKIEQGYKDEKLDKNQYEQLIKKVEELEEVLIVVNEKTKDPAMIKDADIFALLNGRIDGVEAALDKLEEQVDRLEKPIKDRAVRKQINSIVKELEEKIKLIERYLEDNKELDPDKYEATKERLNNTKERLERISKNYRKKCPLLVRAVKGTTAFFKKHKKVCLTIAGLAAMALWVANVGKIIIPMIMYGNVMLGSSTPALSGFVSFVNNILGPVIGAHRAVDSTWVLASGATLNPAFGTSSLLKGLAVCGIGNTALIAPLVISVKKLVEKIKNAELKKKLSEKMTEGKKKISNVKEKLTKGNKERKSSNKKVIKNADKDALDKVAVLLREYRKSGKTFEEFVEEKELTEQELIVLKYLEENSNEYKKEHIDSRKRAK